MTKRYIITAVFLAFQMQVFAQQEQADFMRSTGKIYVVVAVILVILLGLFFYLIRMDKNLTKLENQIKKNGRAKK